MMGGRPEGDPVERGIDHPVEQDRSDRPFDGGLGMRDRRVGGRAGEHAAGVPGPEVMDGVATVLEDEHRQRHRQPDSQAPAPFHRSAWSIHE